MMKLTNTTAWLLCDLRDLAAQVARRECTLQEHAKLDITIAYATDGIHSGGGMAWYYGDWRTTINMPTPAFARQIAERHARIGNAEYWWAEGGTMYPVLFAKVLAHEIGHARGLDHEAMDGTYRAWNGPWREHFSWAAEYPLRLGPQVSRFQMMFVRREHERFVA